MRKCTAASIASLLLRSSVVLTLPLPLLLALATLAEPLAAQRGRGRPEAIVERVGCFFTDVPFTAPADADAEHPFANMAAVQDAKAKEQPALLYLFDPGSEERKLQQYEQTMFNNDELGISLRCFRCLRLDVTKQPELAKYAARAPVHVVFAADGKLVGEVAHTGNKAQVNTLVKLLEKAAAGHVKPSLPVFVKSYRDVVRDLEQVEGKRRALQERRNKLETKDAAKRTEMDKDLLELKEEEKPLLEREKQLLEQAKALPRDPEAKRLGERRWGG